MPLIAGVGTNDTRDSIEFACEVAAFGGFAAGLAIVPYYNKPSQEGMYQHFKAIADATGLLKKMVEASKKEDLKELVQETYTIINDKQAKKAEFALDILYFEDPKKIKTPSYIKEGLNWIEEQLKSNKQGLIN